MQTYRQFLQNIIKDRLMRYFDLDVKILGIKQYSSVLEPKIKLGIESDYVLFNFSFVYRWYFIDVVGQFKENALIFDYFIIKDTHYEYTVQSKHNVAISLIKEL